MDYFLFLRVLGYHSTFCTASTYQSRLRTLVTYLFPRFFVEESWQEQFVKQFTDFYILESGYLHIQATKPDTIGKNNFYLNLIIKCLDVFLFCK